jgi:post-segregation antitoxin (ccd killing protein)
MTQRRGSKAADELRRPWRDRTQRRGRSRATFYLPPDLLNELRNTVVALSGPPHRLTMSRLAETALRREIERLRRDRTGGKRGKPFGQRAGEVTRGRPIG